MTLLQLKYLLAIADNGLNISAAADRLYTSQPGISRQLKLLEQELGEVLFVRHGRSLRTVTPAGVQVIAHARLIMAEVQAIRVGVERSWRAGRREAPFGQQRPGIAPSFRTRDE